VSRIPATAVEAKQLARTMITLKIAALAAATTISMSSSCAFAGEPVVALSRGQHFRAAVDQMAEHWRADDGCRTRVPRSASRDLMETSGSRRTTSGKPLCPAVPGICR
jgi:hypothetical protein